MSSCVTEVNGANLCMILEAKDSQAHQRQEDRKGGRQRTATASKSSYFVLVVMGRFEGLKD